MMEKSGKSELTKNEKFRELPADKQQAILNAAMEVFSKYDYKRASTDLIASKANISKGLLFYYFRNKKELYLYTYEYAARVSRQYITDPAFFQITDFFELLNYASLKKIKMLQLPLQITELEKEFHDWTQLFKNFTYKEEFLHERN